MFRKLTVLICLLSFLPAAAGAQGLPVSASTPTAAISSSADSADPAGNNVNLMLAAEKSATILVAAADTSQATAKATPEIKKESHSSFDMRNFADVHLAEGRWIWWAGALVVLAAIHIAAD